MKKTTYSFIILLFSILLLSCNSENDAIISIPSDVDTNFVDLKEAISLATLLEYDVTLPGGTTKSTISMEVENIRPMGDTHKPSYYVVNYKDKGGFAIISADKRTDGLLAFSTENNFDYNVQELPGGLVEWMEKTSQYIQDVRDSKIEAQYQTPQTRLCEALKSTTLRSTSNCNNNSCPLGYDKLYAVYPLLTTEWHQGSGFNNAVPFFSTSCRKGVSRSYAGCVAIAMAQVMYYYKYPKTYNWSTMDIKYGGGEAPMLIQKIGDAVNMQYKCDGSSANLKDARNSFISTFNYKSAIYGSYNERTIIQQLKKKQPVILRGGTSDGKGHAWICDGYQEFITCTYSTLSFHMNWGWGGLYNGWFKNMNSGAGNFYKDNKMIYNIIPN